MWRKIPGFEWYELDTDTGQIRSWVERDPSGAPTRRAEPYVLKMKKLRLYRFGPDGARHVHANRRKIQAELLKSDPTNNPPV